ETDDTAGPRDVRPMTLRQHAPVSRSPPSSPRQDSGTPAIYPAVKPTRPTRTGPCAGDPSVVDRTKWEARADPSPSYMSNTETTSRSPDTYSPPICFSFGESGLIRFKSAT